MTDVTIPSAMVAEGSYDRSAKQQLVNSVPVLSGANTFVGNQTVTGSLAVSSTVTAAGVTSTAGVAAGGAVTGATTVTATGVVKASGITESVVAITADGAIAPNTSANYVITKAGVALLTLAAPTVTTSDGVIIIVSSATANQHTITATGLFLDGASHVNVATFPVAAGGTITLMAYQGKWLVVASQLVVLS